MSYCTTTDVREILDQVEHLQQSSQSDLDRQIAHAENWLNGYLRAKGYDVPFGTVPVFVQELTATRAAYLTLRRVNSNGQFDDWLKNFKDDMKEMLDDLRSGAVELADAEIDEDHGPGFAVVNPHGAPKYVYDKTGRRTTV